jgi:chromosome segregation ATPase
MSNEEQIQIPPGDLNPRNLDLTNPADVAAMLLDQNNTRTQITSASNNLKRLRTDALSEEDRILNSQIHLQNNNYTVFSSWGRLLQDINSNLSTIRTNQDDMKNNLASLSISQDDMKKDLAVLTTSQDDMKKDLAVLTTSIQWLSNREQVRQKGIFQELPFTVGERPENLPTISSIADINMLTIEQVKTYLTRYGESTRGNELNLKKKLASLHSIPQDYLAGIKTRAAMTAGATTDVSGDAAPPGV